MQYRLNIKKK